MNRYQGIRNLGVAILLGSVLAAAPTVTFAAQPAKSSPKTEQGLTSTLQKLEDDMSKIFQDALKDVRGEKSTYTASIDVREQPERYTVRLHFPERDVSHVQVTLDGQALKVIGASGYEQSITLHRAKPDAPLDITRREHTLVVRVPKGGSEIAEEAKPALPKTPLLAPDTWEQDMLTRMEKMQKDMDRAFEGASKDLHLNSPGLFDKPEFGSSIDLQDEKDHYLVRAYLPGRDTKDVDVKIEGQTLKISAKAETKNRSESKAGVEESFNLSSYAQVLTLPGPVNGNQMKIDRKEGLLVINIPKQGT